MRLIDFVSGVWCVNPKVHKEILKIYKSYMGEEKEKMQLEGQIRQVKRGFKVINQTAIIDIIGVISKRLSFFQELFGGVSTQILQEDIDSALKDSSIKNIILNIDSPGGSSDGIFEFTDFILKAKKEKNIIAFTDGQIASAALLLASACDKIIVSGDENNNPIVTTEVGSLGVRMALIDESKKNEKEGIKIVHIYAGKYKTLGSNDKPLEDEEKEILQNRVNEIFVKFVDIVAKNRNLDVNFVKENIANGLMFSGEKAIELGLADSALSFNNLINSLKEENKNIDNNKSNQGDSSDFNINKEGEFMDLKTFKEEHEDLYDKIKSEGFQAGTEEGIKKGVEQERERVLKINSLRSHFDNEKRKFFLDSFLKKGDKPGDVAISLIKFDNEQKKKIENVIENGQQKVELHNLENENDTKVDLKDMTFEEKTKYIYEKDPEINAKFRKLSHYQAYVKRLKGKE